MAVTFCVPIRAFYCFDPVDRALCQALDRHLAPLKSAGRLQTWDERQVLAGQEWERERDQHFSTARLLFLLLSPDLLASERGQQQIQMVLHRQQAGDAVVIPVLLRPCAWKETELRSLQILPADHEALTTRPHLDKAWQEVVAEISRVLNALQKRVYLVSAPEDQDVVELFSQEMARSGVAIWRFKGEHLSSDLRLYEAAQEAMRQASCVGLIASPAAFSSRVVKAQMELANDYQRPLYVFWVRGEDGAHLHSGPWQAEAVLDARDQGYEAAKTLLLSHFKQPRAAAAPALEDRLPVTKPRNPYKGLDPFTARDTRDFFGRDALVDELATTLEQLLAQEKTGKPDTRLLAVLGTSGSGKSSVVLAGLLPHLQHGGVFESQEWLYLDPIVPGTHPLEALAVSFARQPSLDNVVSLHAAFTSDSLRTLHLLTRQLAGSSARKVVLFIDQFEEVFTLTTSEEERVHFFDLLRTAVTEPQGPLLIILTLRVDFSHYAIQYPALYRLLDTWHVSVLPMERDDLRRVIEQPARLPDVQVTFEGDLVGDLLFDMREQVGALPLLSFTLNQLFAHCNGQMLTLQSYREIGGVKGALARHAQATYDALPTTEHQALARSLFLRLIDPGRTEQETTRRRARLTEFERPDPAQTRLLRETMDAYLSARLLTTNEQAGVATIEVSHEALIREWPRLIEWLREAREDILLQQKISEDAVQWQQRRYPKDRLYRGSQLKEALSWARRTIPSQQEGIFLRASRKQRVRFVALMISLLLLLFATTGFAAWIWFFNPQSPDPTLITTLNNDGVGSLRWAIDTASSGSTITFVPRLAGQTITLTGTLSIPNKKLRLQGSGARRITISNATNGIVVDAGASLTTTNVIFTGSQSNSVSLFSNRGTLTLTNSTVSGNTSTDDGGGISNQGTLTLTNSTVSGNTASTNGGGGISNGGTLTLTNSTVSGNTSTNGGSSGSGGGIDSYQGTVTLTNSTVSGNTSNNSGGGISSYQGNLTLTNSTVSDNTASSYGGGISSGGTLTLTNSTVSGNTASGWGGGISNQRTLTLTNSTVSDNIAYGGGGISNYGGTTMLVFCTLYGNHASTGGGLFTEDDTSYPSHTLPGISTMSNSLVASNQASLSPDIVGKLTTEGYNLIQNTADIAFLDPDHKHSSDLMNIPLSDLKIDPVLRSNGGPTQTHALLPGSPAIDAIPLVACLISVNGVTIATDQRGVKRLQGSACDIGAYEYIL